MHIQPDFLCTAGVPGQLLDNSAVNPMKWLNRKSMIKKLTQKRTHSLNNQYSTLNSQLLERARAIFEEHFFKESYIAIASPGSSPRGE